MEDDAMDIESQVYMACILQGHRLGIAYYDCLSQKLAVLEIWEGDNELFGVQILKQQVQPTLIYTSTKMEETFLAALRKKVSEDAKETTVKTLRSSVFSYEQAWHRLIFVQVNGMADDLGVKERVWHLKSMMNLESEMQVRAAGGLLQVLQDEMLIDPVKNTECGVTLLQIHNISEHSMDKFLTLDMTSYGTLQIFQTDKHPSYMGIGKAKEGFSLFGIFADKCITLMGRRLLRTWFLRPILDLDILNDRLDSISVFSKLDEMVIALHQSLKHAKDIPKLLKRLSCPSMTSTSNDWHQLSKTISCYLYLWEILEVGSRLNKHTIQGLRIVQKFMSMGMEELVSLNDLIARAIDFDQTCGERTTTFISKGVCEELDELKHIYEGLPDFLEQVASAELERLPKQDLSKYTGSIIYFPQTGYLMRLNGKRLAEDSSINLPDFEFVFSNGANGGDEFFYRTTKTKELDQMLGDILNKILDMEREILRSLESHIARSTGPLLEVSEIVAELDCLLAFASVAKDSKYVRPNLTREDVLQIKGGRHPLQELLLDTFVPNDTESSFDKGRINIITGPNYSGKSVYVKQVALIIFLSHIGSFVPAEKVTIGIVDRIFCASACKDTTSIPESTFMMDLHQVSIMLRNSTGKSFCILDEFGEGTLTTCFVLKFLHKIRLIAMTDRTYGVFRLFCITDGIGILCSTLTYFAHSAHPPQVFACTHFSEVFDDLCLPKTENMSFYTMCILERSANSKDEQNITLGHEINLLHFSDLFLDRLFSAMDCTVQSYLGVKKAEPGGMVIENNNAEDSSKKDAKSSSLKGLSLKSPEALTKAKLALEKQKLLAEKTTLGGQRCNTNLIWE